LIDAYAGFADWRDAGGQVALFADDALWVPEIVHTTVDLPLRHRPRPGMIRRWR
jgi:hypothetical protein